MYLPITRTRIQINKAYKNLNLIIHKNKFLIPQKPFAPIRPYIQYKIFLSQQPGWDQLLKYGQKQNKITEFILQRIGNEDPDYLKIKQKYDQQILQFRRKKIEYTDLYINPQKIFSKYKPYIHFIVKIMKQAKEKQQKLTITQASKKWTQLNEATKQKINKECEQQKQKYLPIYLQYIKKHEIPIIKKFSAISVFLSQSHNLMGRQDQQNQQTNNMIPIFRSNQKFNQLSILQKQEYKLKALLKKTQAQKQYTNFLERWGLTQKQFLYIKQICQQYNKQKISNKKNKKIINDFQQNQNEDEQSDY